MARSEPNQDRASPHRSPSARGDARLSRASVGRLSLYLRRLEESLAEGKSRISSKSLGDTLAISDAQVRKDLASLGRLGQAGVGYDAADLVEAIRSRLGIDRIWRAALIGVGNLGRALLRYNGFQQRGFRIVALFDSDPQKVGQQVGSLRIHGPDSIGEMVRKLGVELGVLTVPASAVQNMASTLAEAGVKGLLNFAPEPIQVPPTISVVHVDLAMELEHLAFLVHLNETMP